MSFIRTFGERPADDFNGVMTHLPIRAGTNADTNYNPEMDEIASIKNSGTPELSTEILMKIDLADIMSEGWTLQDARLFMFVTTDGGIVQNDIGWQAWWETLDWVIGEATWNVYSTGNAWPVVIDHGKGNLPSAPCNDVGTRDSDSLYADKWFDMSIDIEGDQYSRCLTELVGLVLDGTIEAPAGVVNLLLKNVDSGAISFIGHGATYSTDETLRPYLELQFAGDDPAGGSSVRVGQGTFDDVAGATVDANLRGGASANSNFSTESRINIRDGGPTASTSNQALFKFDLTSELGKTISSARLMVNMYSLITADHAVGEFEIWSCARDWTDGLVTWNDYDGSNPWSGTLEHHERDTLLVQPEIFMSDIWKWLEFTSEDFNTYIQGVLDGTAGVPAAHANLLLFNTINFYASMSVSNWVEAEYRPYLQLFYGGAGNGAAEPPGIISARSRAAQAILGFGMTF